MSGFARTVPLSTDAATRRSGRLSYCGEGSPDDRASFNPEASGAMGGTCVPESLMFVQFPHPGLEHKPKGTWMEWNRRDHARKFLKASGKYIASGEERWGPFVFWGEWEPQSRVLEAFSN